MKTSEKVVAFNIWVASRAVSRVCFLIGLLSCASASADVRRITADPLNNAIRIVISGQITQQDLAFFSSHSKEFEFEPLKVFLNSSGGDVDAAMKVGRIIRSADGETRIRLKGRCYSGCALIFIAGVKRENFGELGLHRPYFASAPLSRQQIEKQLPVMRSAVKGYVEEMGVTDGFFERMFNKDPSGIDILRGPDESEKIVPETDPTYDEIETSRKAQQYGLTTSEYRKRDLLANSCYTYDRSGVMKINLATYLCVNSSRWGLSVTDFQSRSAKAEARCIFPDAEKKRIDETIPKRDRYSDPIYLQYITCRLNTMRALPSWDETTPSPPQGSPPKRLPSWDETKPAASK
jgi:hypothetical protein